MNKLIMILFAALTPQMALAFNCNGSVSIPSQNREALVSVDFEKLESGARMGLWQKVTSNNFEYIYLNILSAEKTSDGRLVKTRYSTDERSNLDFVYTEDSKGSVHLQNFQGTEDGIVFGPGTLACEEDF